MTVEETFQKFMALAASLDAETERAVREGLTEPELALYDLLGRDDLSKVDREKLKQASRQLYAKVKATVDTMRDWTAKEATRAEVRVRILDELLGTLPMPPFTPALADELAGSVFNHVWQQSLGGDWATAAVA